MILGLGTDIVQVKRFQSWSNNQKLMRRFFSDAELEWCLSQAANMAASLAARFAVKEAFGKAMGTGLIGFKLRDISVIKNKLGQPKIVLATSAQKKLNEFLTVCGSSKSALHLSMSHEKDFAIATVIIEG